MQNAVPGAVDDHPQPSMTMSLLILAASAVPRQLPGVLRTLEGPLNSFGYLAVAGFVFLEDFGVPVPGETILIVAAVYAGTGRLSIFLVALLGFLAAVLGDNVGFAIGRLGGQRLLSRFGRYILLTPERVEKATGFFERHGGKIIVVARFVEGLRQANGIIAGLIGMRWLRFLAFNAIGATLWVALWTSVGYFSGDHIDAIYSDVTRYDTYFAIAVVVLLIFYIARRVRRRRKRAGAPEDGSPQPASRPLGPDVIRPARTGGDQAGPDGG
jgi:membrane protein DedA with SNARE-associated domain